MRNRDRIFVGALACLLAVAGFWFLALKPKRAESATAAARAAEAQTRLQAATDALATATTARASFETDYATVARLGKAVPADDDAASVVFQIEAAARKAGIDFRALAVGGNGAAAAPAATPSTGSSSSPSSSSSSSSSSSPSSSSSSSSSSGTGAAAPTPTPSALPPGVVAGTDGMNRLPFTFTFDGEYFELTELLDLLRSFTTAKGDTVTVRGRLLTVEGVNLEQGRNGFPNVKATVSATAYLSSEPVTLPSSAATGANATPATTPTTTAPSNQAAGTSPVPAATATPGAVR